jgi:sugar-specific transcriptional regulator TrmB
VNTNTNPEAALSALGFTDIEAAVYCELLRAGACTGYKVSQAIGKAPANVYQALAGLTQRGAVMLDDGDTRVYRATAPDELLTGLRREFEGSRAQAQRSLATLESPTADDRIYQLKSPVQLYERAAQLVNNARQILLFDLFPQPLEQLLPLLLQAHARGVTVAGLCYGERPAVGFHVSQGRTDAAVFERWPGMQLSLVADAREHLLALISSDGASVRHGVWSDSAYLACLQHSGLAAEIRLLANPPAGGGALGHLSLLHAYPPGLQTLLGPYPAPAGAPP